MTPITGPQAPASIFPSRLEEGSSVSRRRYILARILEGDRRSLSNPEQDSLSLQQRLNRLPIAERERIQQEAGPAYHALVSLSEEGIPELFYQGLFQAGRQAEDADRFGVAQTCYFFLSRLSEHGSPVPAHLQRQARERLMVLGGGGSRWERIEFAMHRFPSQALDPTFFIGMGAASIAARAFRLRLLLGAANSMGVTPRIIPQIFRAGMTGTVESVAFIGAERASAAILGRPASSASMPEEWLRYGLPMFLGTRLAGTLVGQIYRRGRFRQPWLSHGSLEGARWRHRLGYGLATQASIFSAAYFAQELENDRASAERRPHDAIANALLWTLTFSVFHSTARRMTGSRVVAWERGLFRPR